MKLVVVVVLVSVLIVGAIRITASSAAHARIACGVERWTVKTLQDRPVLSAARTVTIQYLITRPRPSNIGDSRTSFEHNRFTVTAAVTLVRQEADGDLHLVLQAGGDHMIAESPMLACTNRAPSVYRTAMATARSHVRLCARAQVTGVAFFDFDHGQTGVAPNAIELHPVLSFRCLTT